MNDATEAVGRLLADWTATRMVLAELDREAHPDITDGFGRVWTYKPGGGDPIYVHDSLAGFNDSGAGPQIMTPRLPPETLADNWNYHRLCEICTREWSPEAKAKHAQNAIDYADYERLGWDEFQKLKGNRS
jgi:hypothetical protein